MGATNAVIIYGDCDTAIAAARLRSDDVSATMTSSTYIIPEKPTE